MGKFAHNRFWEQRQLRLIPFLYVHRSVPVKSSFRISLWKISLFYWILTGTNNKSCSQFCVVLSSLKIWLWSVISITTFSEVFPKWFLIFKWENMAAVLWQLLFCSLIFPILNCVLCCSMQAKSPLPWTVITSPLGMRPTRMMWRQPIVRTTSCLAGLPIQYSWTVTTRMWWSTTFGERA